MGTEVQRRNTKESSLGYDRKKMTLLKGISVNPKEDDPLVRDLLRSKHKEDDPLARDLLRSKHREDDPLARDLLQSKYKKKMTLL